MDVDAAAAAIANMYSDQLELLRRAVLVKENAASERNPLGVYKPQALSGLQSINDRHAEVSIAVELAELAYAEGDPALDGYKVTVSMAGHDRILGGRISLDLDEYDAWLYAVLGWKMAPKAYHAGALSGDAEAGRLTTVYYHVYLNQDLKPGPRPNLREEVIDEVPVRPESFA